MSNLLAPEPLIDLSNLADGLDGVLPIQYDYLSSWKAGEVGSNRLGSGFAINGVHDYRLGDDIRLIDWHATARHPEQTLQVREQYADITPSLWVATDISKERYNTGAGYYSEFGLAASGILTIMRAAEAQGIPIAIAANGDHDLFVQTEPVIGAENLLAMGPRITSLVEAKMPQTRDKRRLFSRRKNRMQPKVETDLTLRDTLSHVSRLATQSVVAVVSDFRYCVDPANETNGWAQSVMELANEGNDVIALEVKNPWDDKLPESVERFRLNGASVSLHGKTGDAIRERYIELAAKQQEAIDRNLQDANVTHIKLSTANPFWRTSLYEQLLAANQ